MHLADVPWKTVIALVAHKEPDVRGALCRGIAHTTPFRPWIANGAILKRKPFPRSLVPRIAQIRDDRNTFVRNCARLALKALNT